MSKQPKRPSFQFYPGDWLNDAALRLVSVGARGLWIDMLCMMHQGTPYGHLKVAGKVILPSNLARTLGATLPEVEGWLAELKEVNAYSINEDGCIYSRRMVRDEEIRLKRAEGGTYGGNPALGTPKKPHPKEGKKVNQNPTLDPTLPPPPSSSSSSSLSPPKSPVSVLHGLPPEWREGEIAEAIQAWCRAYAERTGKTHSDMTITQLVWQWQSVKGWTPEKAIEAISYTISNPHFREVEHQEDREAKFGRQPAARESQYKPLTK